MTHTHAQAPTQAQFQVCTHLDKGAKGQDLLDAAVAVDAPHHGHDCGGLPLALPPHAAVAGETHLHLARARKTFQQNGELVPAQARHHVAGADGAPDAVCHLLQQPVPDVVAEGVVDYLEFIEIECSISILIELGEEGLHILNVDFSVKVKHKL